MAKDISMTHSNKSVFYEKQRLSVYEFLPNEEKNLVVEHKIGNTFKLLLETVLIELEL